MVEGHVYLCPASQGTMPTPMPEVPCNRACLVGPSPAPAKIARAPVPGQIIPDNTFLVSALQLQIPGLDAEWMVQWEPRYWFTLHVEFRNLHHVIAPR